MNSLRLARGALAHARWLSAITVLAVLSACGGGDSKGGGGPTESPSGPTNDRPATAAEASRFLHQASFGATQRDIEFLSSQGMTGWINDQFNKPQQLHRSYLDRRSSQRVAAGESAGFSQEDFHESWWGQAVRGEDQLRQRVSFALSQIFVVSFLDSTVSGYPRGVASYYDTLGQHAFGNYRDLLRAVSLHPMMGIYLSHMRNQKENTSSGRVPDENYAREVMQLFSIGLYELNPDGTLKMAGGAPIETYTHADVQGLAKVFTGWSWYAGQNLADRTNSRFFGGGAHADRDWNPMQAYNKYANNTDFHSTSEKRFLGRTIGPQGNTPNPEGDLEIALDTLFNHPNVGPFICRQLIQRMVTSNPSPGYVGRCANAFNGGASGTRGDMRSVIKAVLLDSEARNHNPADLQFGKLREPVIRLANWMRAFGVNTNDPNGRFRGVGETDSTGRLAQAPMRSGSVFNFYRPGYTPPNTSIAAAGLVAPELQLAHEVSVADYLNYIRGWIQVNTNASRYLQQNYTTELSLVEDPATLVDRVSLLLAASQLAENTRSQIVGAVSSRAIPRPTTNSSGAVTNQAAIDSARRDRVYLAIFLTMASPDYLIQK